MYELHKNRVRSTRTEVVDPMFVKSRTIGSRVNFPLKSENISRSGLLLTWNGDERIPYQVKTILELEIDPDHTMFDTPISCLGKVVRMANTDSTDGASNRQFGIMIVQISPRDQSSWETKIAELEDVNLGANPIEAMAPPNAA